MVALLGSTVVVPFRLTTILRVVCLFAKEVRQVLSSTCVPWV